MGTNENRDSQFDHQILKLLEALHSVPPRDRQSAMQGQAAFSEEGQMHLPKKSQSWFGWFINRRPKEKLNMSTTQKFTLSSLVLAVIALVLFFGSFSATALAAGNSIPGDSCIRSRPGLNKPIFR